jgi:hypothetical protein
MGDVFGQPDAPTETKTDTTDKRATVEPVPPTSQVLSRTAVTPEFVMQSAQTTLAVPSSTTVTPKLVFTSPTPPQPAPASPPKPAATSLKVDNPPVLALAPAPDDGHESPFTKPTKTLPTSGSIDSASEQEEVTLPENVGLGISIETTVPEVPTEAPATSEPGSKAKPSPTIGVKDYGLSTQSTKTTPTGPYFANLLKSAKGSLTTKVSPTTPQREAAPPPRSNVPVPGASAPGDNGSHSLLANLSNETADSETSKTSSEAERRGQHRPQM